jgi:hypothetical protein
MHNITKSHCTQYTHYTVSPKLTHVQVTQPVDITIQYLSVARKYCLYLNSFSTLTYTVISTVYTVKPCKSTQLIQMSDIPYKYENLYPLLSMYFKQHTFQEADGTMALLTAHRQYIYCMAAKCCF